MDGKHVAWRSTLPTVRLLHRTAWFPAFLLSNVAHHKLFHDQGLRCDYMKYKWAMNNDDDFRGPWVIHESYLGPACWVRIPTKGKLKKVLIMFQAGQMAPYSVASGLPSTAAAQVLWRRLRLRMCQGWRLSIKIIQSKNSTEPSGLLKWCLFLFFRHLHSFQVFLVPNMSTWYGENSEG